MQMRMGGWLLAAYSVLFALVLIFRDKLDLFGLSNFAFALLGPALGNVIEVSAKQIKSYQPTSALDAKIANEKIKLWISTLNATAITLIGAGFALPLIQSVNNPQNALALLPTENIASFLLIVLGGYIHIRARGIFNFLKDELAIQLPDQVSSV